MIKEKSKTRITNLEKKLPKDIGEDTVIPLTEEAQELLQPWYSALMESDREWYLYQRKYTPESLFWKCAGDSLALLSTEDYYALPESVRPPDMSGMPEKSIDARVARKMIECLERYGISIE